MSDLASNVGFAVGYIAVGLLLLVAAGYVVDLLTPGHLIRQIAGGSYSAALNLAAALFGQSLVIFTAIWRNATNGYGTALRDTIAFGIVGSLAAAVAFLVIDVIVRLFTGIKLGTIVCEPGSVRPAAIAAAGMQIGLALIVVASIA
jgi:uncharacterized membrane protein YjfL (UPF0719 family)